MFNAEGVCCYGTNTSIEELKAVRMVGDAEARFTIESLDLVEGTYKLDVAIHKLDGYPYDYHRLLYTFGSNRGPRTSASIVHATNGIFPTR